MKKPALTIIFIVLSFTLLKAQETASSDEIFKNARDAAFEDKNYAMAKQLAFQALKISPAYADIEIFLGRVYAWNNQYDSARYHFSKVLNTDPVNEDASIAYADLEYWDEHYEKALDICNAALSSYPASQLLLIRKAKNLNALKKYNEASRIADDILKVDKGNKDAFALALAIKNERAVNKISIGYDHSSFDKQFNKDWNFVSFSYGRKTKLGTVIARMNYASRFGSDGVQGEVDAYPRISKTFYSYVSFGYSGNVGVFPKYRAGFSLYANLPESFEAEVGLRYLNFTSATNVYTFALGKYYKSFLFNARTYLTPSDGSLSQSYSLAAHYYFKGADDFISLSIGTGISPDDNNQNIQFSNKQNKLSSKKISGTFSHTFLKWNIISLGAGLINQEYQPFVKGNQLNLSVSLTHRF